MVLLLFLGYSLSQCVAVKIWATKLYFPHYESHNLNECTVKMTVLAMNLIYKLYSFRIMVFLLSLQFLVLHQNYKWTQRHWKLTLPGLLACCPLLEYLDSVRFSLTLENFISSSVSTRTLDLLSLQSFCLTNWFNLYR